MQPRALLFLCVFLTPLLTAQTDSNVRIVEVNGQTVAYTVQDGYAITQGDIILGRADEIEGYRQAQARRPGAALPQSIHAVFGATGSQLWPNATMYYTIDANTPVPQNLLDAVAYWNGVGPFKILPRDSQPNYVTFRSVTTDAACQSFIGMVGGQQIIGVTSACSVGSAIHELGHAWGLLHEQVRSDRGGNITILYDNIDKRYYSDFNQSTSSADAGYYDFDSIMHYSAGGFGRTFEETMETVPPGIPIGQRLGLSAGDIDGVSRLYGFVPTATTITTTPSGLPIVVDGVSGTSPQTFSWAPGSQHTVSVPAAQGTAPRLKFAGWSDGGSVAHTVTATANRTVFCANFTREFLAQAGVASGFGTASIFPATSDNYLPDRTSFLVTATPAAGSQFLRWTGTTFLGSEGLSVSATPARVEVPAGVSNYMATFTSAPLTVVDSQPEGGNVLVDGASYYTPVSFAWAAGSQHTLSYPSPQLRGTSTVRYEFLNWENGATGVRTVTAGTAPVTYTATVRKQFLLTTPILGPGTVTASPASSDGFYDAGTQVQLTATPAAGQFLRYWIGDAAGAGTQQTVVMDQERLATANFGTQYPWIALNGASFTLNSFFGSSGQSVAPGEIVTIFGAGIGPSVAVAPAVGSNGRLPTTAGGVSVFFDKYPAPITYAGPNQINLVVPYEISGQSSTAISINNNGTLTAPFVGLSVYATAPGLFTLNGSGKGPVAALNENGTVNTAQNPADAGSVMVLYGTGGGALNKTVADGEITGANLPAPVAPVYVRIGKLPADLLYAGSAPFLVSGALQVNVRLPKETIGGGQVPIQLIVGAYTSAPGTTIWVK